MSIRRWTHIAPISRPSGIEGQASSGSRAFKALLQDGRELLTLGEPLGKPDFMICRRIVDRRGLVTAVKSGEMPIDVVLGIKGAEFSDLKKRRRVFTVAGVRVPCACLQDLLDAKQNAGRGKDRVFLRLYRAALGKPRAARR